MDICVASTSPLDRVQTESHLYCILMRRAGKCK